PDHRQTVCDLQGALRQPGRDDRRAHARDTATGECGLDQDPERRRRALWTDLSSRRGVRRSPGPPPGHGATSSLRRARPSHQPGPSRVARAKAPADPDPGPRAGAGQRGRSHVDWLHEGADGRPGTARRHLTPTIIGGFTTMSETQQEFSFSLAKDAVYKTGL